jgi:uncharacterized protein
MEPVIVATGMVVGLSLGLTGGGGAIFAVPLLVFLLGVAPREAVGVSLAAVGATALVGFFQRLRHRQVELGTGLLFALAGMLGAPLGAWAAGQIPEALLLLLFAALMLVVAGRMWAKALPVGPIVECAQHNPHSGPACRRDSGGRLLLTSRCAILLALLGFGAGVLSGLFGVGGGFVIVPALVLFSGMEMPRAVGTSLLVIALVSAVGVVSQQVAGSTLPLALTGWFLAGGIAGLSLGTWMGRRIGGPALQRTFAAAMVAVAAFVIVRSLA